MQTIDTPRHVSVASSGLKRNMRSVVIYTTLTYTYVHTHIYTPIIAYTSSHKDTNIYSNTYQYVPVRNSTKKNKHNSIAVCKLQSLQLVYVQDDCRKF